jgi:hypothetical protein
VSALTFPTKIKYLLLKWHVRSEATEGLWGNMTKSKWLSVVKLATMWAFKDIRALAIDRLTEEEMGAIERVLLAKQYNVPQWLRAGYKELVMRTQMLSLEDAGQLSYLTAILIFQVREQASIVNGTSNRTRYGAHAPAVDASSIIERVFQTELQEMEFTYNQYRPQRSQHEVREEAGFRMYAISTSII